MVKFSVGVGLLIELWKVTKCLRFIPAPEGESGILGTGWSFEEKRKAEDSETSKYDKIAFKGQFQTFFEFLKSFYFFENRGFERL